MGGTRVSGNMEKHEYETRVGEEIERLSKSTDHVYATMSDAKLAAIAALNSREAIGIGSTDMGREYTGMSLPCHP